MPLVYTEEYAQSLPSLQGLTPEQRYQVTIDSRRVYNAVRQREQAGSPFPTEDAIRQFFLSAGTPIGTTAMTLALQFLRETGRMYWIADVSAPIGDTPVGARVLPEPPSQGVAPPPVREVPLEEMTKADLRALAGDYEIEGRSKMSERQLRNAIKRHEEEQGARAVTVDPGSHKAASPPSEADE